MAEFDTTKIQMNSPGLTYSSPQALSAKPNNFGNAVKTANSIIQGAVAFDEKMVMGEAQEEAELLANEYQQQSKTNLATLEAKQNYLQNQIASNPEADREPWIDELESITNKYNLAKAQGIMSPYEFQSRSSAAAAEISERNPAYADKIAQKMNTVFQRGNLNTLLDADIKAIQDAQKAQQKIYDDKVAYLNKKFIDTEGLDSEELDLVFQQERMKDRTQYELDELVKTKVQLNEKQKYEFYDNILAEYPESGINGAAQSRYNLLYTQLNVLADSQLDPKEITNQSRKLIAGQRQYIDWFVQQIPSEMMAREDITAFRTKQNNMITTLETQFEKVVPGNMKDFLQNQKDIMTLRNELEVLDNDWNQSAAENAEMMAKTFSTIVNDSKLLTMFGQENLDSLRSKLNNAMIGIVGGNGQKLDTNTRQAKNWASLNHYGSLKNFNELATAELADMGNMTVQTRGWFNNIWQKTDQQTGNNKQKELDSIIPLITSNLDDKVFNKLMSSEADFSSSLFENASFYKEALITTIPEGTELTMSNGLFYYPEDKRINNNVTRLNNYVLLQSKLQGKKPSEIAPEIIATDFPMYGIKGITQTMPSGQIGTPNQLFGNPITKEEYDNLPSGATYTAPDGTVRTKG